MDAFQKNKEDTSIYYFASTHWDREWYLSFQAFRYRFIKVLSEAMCVLEQDPSFSQFYTDGQTVVLEDYLEIMPQDRARLVSLMEAGRLVVGPWYTMPDECLVSGESLLRNLETGHRILRTMAPDAHVMPVGYVCDVFGHAAQLPQILNGFGIRNAVVGRGTNQDHCPSYFLWEAPDGSQCAAFKLPETMGYGTFWYDVYDACAKEGRTTFSDLLEKACGYVRGELARNNLPLVLLMDGMDHEAIHPEAPELLCAMGRTLDCGARLGGVDAFFDQVWQCAGQLPVMHGELREPAKKLVEHNRLITGTLTSRYDIKRENDVCQVLLEKCAQPLSAAALLAGAPIPQGFLTTAWRLLLQNQAHDSICGCSIDQVHQDMRFRFRQVRQIAQEVYEDGAARAFGLAPCGVPKDGVNHLLVCNPLPFAQNREINTEVWLPRNYHYTFDAMIPTEPVAQFRLLDTSGKETPYQITGIRKGVTRRTPGAFYGTECDVYAVKMTASLPAMGCSCYTVQPSEVPVRYFQTLRTGALQCENRWLRLEISQSGAVSLTCRESGRRIEDLFRYLDYSETGDGWFKRECVPSRTVCSAAAVSIEVCSEGCTGTTFCIVHHLQLPRCVEYDRQYTERSTVLETVPVRTYLTLEPSSPYLICRTEVDNRVRDHRLAISFHTGVDSETYFADQPFCFVERPVALNPDTASWRETDTAEKLFSSVVYRRGKDGSGFAFLAKGGLHEAGAFPDAGGRMDVTLFRSFSKTFLTGGEQDGQLPGPQTFDYILYPFGPETTNAELLRIRDCLQTPLFAMTQAEPFGSPQPCGLELLDGRVVCSTVTPSANCGNRVLVRLVNYSGEPVTERLRCPASVCEVNEVDFLESTPGAPLTPENTIVTISLRPYEIRTLSLRQGKRMPAKEADT